MQANHKSARVKAVPRSRNTLTLTCRNACQPDNIVVVTHDRHVHKQNMLVDLRRNIGRHMMGIVDTLVVLQSGGKRRELKTDDDVAKLVSKDPLDVTLKVVDDDNVLCDIAELHALAALDHLQPPPMPPRTKNVVSRQQVLSSPSSVRIDLT